MRTRVTLFTLLLVVTFSASWAKSEDGKTVYPNMAPLQQYLMERAAEIELARSAAPESIARDADVQVLGPHGFETAIKGKNGFVCLVERSWSASKDDPDFWNPKLRAPICFNPPAARSYLPITIKRTELILAGLSTTPVSKDQMFAGLEAAIASKQLPAPEAGAIGYMMSKQGYLSDRDGHWRPHLMFFAPVTDPALWGANVSGSPVIAFKDTSEHRTVFLLPVSKWSDGTDAAGDAH